MVCFQFSSKIASKRDTIVSTIVGKGLEILASFHQPGSSYDSQRLSRDDVSDRALPGTFTFEVIGPELLMTELIVMLKDKYGSLFQHEVKRSDRVSSLSNDEDVPLPREVRQEKIS